MILQKEKSEYIILTKDHSKVLVGQGKRYHFENTDKAFGSRNGKIRTYRSRKVAENLILEYNMSTWLPDLYEILYERPNNREWDIKQKDKYINIKKFPKYDPYTGKVIGEWTTSEGWNEEAKKVIQEELYKHFDILEVKLSYVEVENNDK